LSQDTKAAHPPATTLARETTAGHVK